MSMSDGGLARTDPAMDLGKRVLGMLAEGYDGEQITTRMDITAGRAEEVLAAYAARVLHRTAPTMPSPACGRNTYDGWCFTHGVFHVADHEAGGNACMEQEGA